MYKITFQGTHPLHTIRHIHAHTHLHYCSDTKWFTEVEVSQRTAAAHHNHKINHNTHCHTHTRLPPLTHTFPSGMRNKLRLIKHKSHCLLFLFILINPQVFNWGFGFYTHDLINTLNEKNILILYATEINLKNPG